MASNYSRGLRSPRLAIVHLERLHARGLLLTVALVLTLPAFAAQPPVQSPVRLTEAWIRWQPAGLPAAAYLTIANTGSRPLHLVGASSPAYAEVSLHQTQNKAGAMQMVAIQQLEVAPHTTLRFAGSGYHFMLMGPKQPIQPGDRVAITLDFSDAPTETVSFDVRKPDASDSPP
jgi:copper(I)-binding protein